MSTPGSLLWFARFETRLAWRDAFAMMTAGRAGRRDLPTFVIVTAGIFLSGSAMLAQAMESVTRTFYLRSDLELILSAPVQAGKLFAVRIAAMALSAAFMSMLVIGPFIDVLAWRAGVQWLGAYGVLIAVSVTSTALAVALAILLFKI